MESVRSAWPGVVRCPSEASLIPPLTFGEIEDVPHDFEPRIDRPCLHLVLFTLRDERLKSAHVHLLQHEISDEEIELPEQTCTSVHALSIYLSTRLASPSSVRWCGTWRRSACFCLFLPSYVHEECR